MVLEVCWEIDHNSRGMKFVLHNIPVPILAWTLHNLRVVSCQNSLTFFFFTGVTPQSDNKQSTTDFGIPFYSGRQEYIPVLLLLHNEVIGIFSILQQLHSQKTFVKLCCSSTLSKQFFFNKKTALLDGRHRFKSRCGLIFEASH